MLKNRCVDCDYVIEAPDESSGKEVECPECGSLNLLFSAKDAKLRVVQTRLAEDRERRQFMEALAQSRTKSSRLHTAGATAEAWEPPIEQLPARNLSILAGRRLKDVSVYLLSFAYLLLISPIILGAVIWLKGDLGGLWGVFAFVICSLTGIATFIGFKFLSDAIRALADLCDLGRSLDSRQSRLANDLQSLTAKLDSAQAEQVREPSSTVAGPRP